MDFVTWFKRLDAWRSNHYNMWKQREERKRLLAYIDTLVDVDDAKELKDFFENNRLDRFSFFPYQWARAKNFPEPKVYFDALKKMYYVDWHGKKLYWKKGASKENVVNSVRFLKIEQHENSPHRYEMLADLSGGVVADLGTAEGCFALDIINRASHVYLFECDKAWMEPLEATFAPWKDKVTIVQKYIGAHNGGDFITLDTYFADKPLDFVKADIEGAEVDMISSGEKTLCKKVRGVNICLYHRAADEVKILDLLKGYGYACSINPGYMFCYKSDGMGNSENPKDWLRRGVVRAERIA